MSLKSWEKTEDDDFLVYKNENQTITIWRPYLDEKLYTIVIKVGKSTVTRKNFRKRSKALKFARAYMRNH